MIMGLSGVKMEKLGVKEEVKFGIKREDGWERT